MKIAIITNSKTIIRKLNMVYEFISFQIIENMPKAFLFFIFHFPAFDYFHEKCHLRID